jgi:hypothetical protein
MPFDLFYCLRFLARRRREALAPGVLVAAVAEGAEDMGVLVTPQAVRVGHHGVNGGANHPEGVLVRQHRPSQR